MFFMFYLRFLNLIIIVQKIKNLLESEGRFKLYTYNKEGHVKYFAEMFVLCFIYVVLNFIIIRHRTKDNKFQFHVRI